MKVLLFPENPSATPLPWLLLQTPKGNYFIGKRDEDRKVIAAATYREDAALIFRVVHAYQPMRVALQMLKSKLYVDRNTVGATRLAARFNHQEFLMIARALAIAEMEDLHER